jgi:ribonuclease HI
LKIYAYTDGAARGNPGRGASGYHLLDGSHKLLVRHVFHNGVCTNNVAEYKAVVAALRKALELFGAETEVVVVSDSNVVINQLSGKYKVKSDNLKALNKEGRELLAKFRSHRLLNVRRENEHIALVDRELNELLDGKAEGTAAPLSRQRNLKTNE